MSASNSPIPAERGAPAVPLPGHSTLTPYGDRRKTYIRGQRAICPKSYATGENESFRASGLSLITAAIVHWNTVYLARAVHQLRAQGITVPNDLLAHVAPLGWEHIALTGDYVWSAVKPEAGFRELRDVHAEFLSQAA